MLTISVIIPVRDDASALGAAIESIDNQQDVQILDICVAVGPSTDGTAEVANQLAASRPELQVIENPSGRTPSALNLAIAATRGDLVVRVDARSVLPPRYIADAVETMEATGAANVGAIQVPVGSTRAERAIASAMTSRIGSGMARYRHAKTVVQADTGYLGVFRRSALSAVGGFDERLVRNQDSELNIRLREAGHQVWLDPRLSVTYVPRGSLRALGSQYFQYGWWRAKTVRAHPASLRLRQLVPAAATFALGVCVVLAIVVDARFLLGPGLYVGALVATGIANRSGLRLVERALFVAALATIHLSWGTGFIGSVLQMATRVGR